MIGICENGHLTGFKKCGCGSLRQQFSPGQGSVQVARHERPRNENGLNELDALRRATRHSTGPQGPNKNQNGPR